MFFSNAAAILSRASAFLSTARALHSFTFYYFDHKLITLLLGVSWLSVKSFIIRTMSIEIDKKQVKSSHV